MIAKGLADRIAQAAESAEQVLEEFLGSTAQGYLEPPPFDRGALRRNHFKGCDRHQKGIVNRAGFRVDPQAGY